VSGPPTPAAADFLPSRGLPLLYLATGLASLAGAFAVVAVDPAGVAGFFYHPRMLAVVHLVTLGWISGSILGGVHIVGPLALRMPLRATAGDLAGFAAFAVGMLGMVSHFWLDTPNGMAWSAGLASLAFVRASVRVLPRLARAKVPTAVKVPVGLAFANVLAAAALGVLLGINQLSAFLPVSHLQAVLAHAHLAVLGFGTLMVMGAGYRLLPMILPAAMTRGRGPLASAVLVEAGVLGLAASFFQGGRGRPGFALVAAAGLFLFLAHVVAMLRDPRPAPPERPRPDLPRAQALAALAYLALATLSDLALVLVPSLKASSPLSLAYGTFGLVGFLAQMVVAVQQRLLPLAAWLWAFAGAQYQAMPPSLHDAPGRLLPALAFAGWTLGTPLLAACLALESLSGLRAGAALLLLGTVAHGAGLVRTLRRLRALDAGLAARGDAYTQP
jgi:hypothetical protein